MKPRTILMQAGTLIPESLRVEAERVITKVGGGRLLWTTR